MNTMAINKVLKLFIWIIYCSADVWTQEGIDNDNFAALNEKERLPLLCNRVISKFWIMYNLHYTKMFQRNYQIRPHKNNKKKWKTKKPVLNKNIYPAYNPIDVDIRAAMDMWKDL